MMTRLAVLLSLFAMVGLLIATGCSPDTEGERAAGQECTDDVDCAEGLVCSERVCRSVDDNGVDAGDVGDDTDDGPDDDAGVNDDEDVVDNNDEPGIECDPGDTRCDSDTVVERCVSGDDGPYWTLSNCPDDHVCDNGQCVDESDPNGYCCPDGCGEGEICHNCQCEDYDPDQCGFQDQPCSNEGQIANDYVCTDIGGDDLRCIGLCEPAADDPDNTCPDSNTICQFEDSTDPNGYCMTSCSIGDGCADDWMTCIYNASSIDDGLCQPQTGTAQPGDPCDSEDPFGCEGTALCIGGFCQDTCRPFGQDDTDCDDGYCLALNADVGICADDSSLNDDDCSAQFTTCGEDATICVDETPQNPQDVDLSCRDACRTELGDEDCDGDESCEVADPDNPTLGICQPD